MKNKLCLSWSLLVGLFLLTSNAEAARATTLILGKSKPEPKIDTLPTAEEESAVSLPPDSQIANETVTAGNVTKLTGVPQIDYIYDPNLPRELNGYNLTDYPFYNSIPEDIDFKCDGLHDGFYASIPHKCQVYHHCLFGTRYDFLCANYTAFDQKTFICHFASEVDCKNSPKYFNRNEALYKAQTTTTLSPVVPSVLISNTRRQQEGQGSRRRRPYRRRKPAYDYYDDYDESSEQDYYDDEPPGRKRKKLRPNNRDNLEISEERDDDEEKSSASGPNKSLYDRPRIAPKIRRPVPVNERDKYDYSSDSRAILAKEPIVEKTRFEARESDSKKGNYRPTDYYEPMAHGNSKNKDSDDERDKEQSRDEYEGERDRERDKERNRERDRDSDRLYRERRPPKKRRRPDNIDADDYEHEDVRRYRPASRNRPRYDDYDDEYEYEDRPYRSRNRDIEYRPREYEYDREKGYRSRDSDYERPRNRDRIRGSDDKPIRSWESDNRPAKNRDIEDKPIRSREDNRPLSSGKVRENEERFIKNRDDERSSRIREDDRPYRIRETDDEYYGSTDDDRGREQNDKPNIRNKSSFQRNEGKIDKNIKIRDREPVPNERSHYSEIEDKKSLSKLDYDDEPDSEKLTGTDQQSYKFTSHESTQNKHRQIYKQENEKAYRNPDNISTRNRDGIQDEKVSDVFRNPERSYSRNRENGERPAKNRVVSADSDVDEFKARTDKEESEKVVPRFGGTRTRITDLPEKSQQRTRQGISQRVKASSPEKDLNEDQYKRLEEEERTSRPVSNVRHEIKAQPEQNSRKQMGSKRIHYQRPSSLSEVPSESAPRIKANAPSAEQRFPLQQPPESYEREITEKPRTDAATSKDITKSQSESDTKAGIETPISNVNVELEIRTPASAKQREREQISEVPKFKVPFDEQESEELAPQAPKTVQTSPRRRPFLPSRGGNQTLPRGLLPVGNKALPTPRGFQKGAKTSREESPGAVKENGNSQAAREFAPSPLDKPEAKQVSTPIEFRAKLSTAIGVQEPQLSAALYEHPRSQSELSASDESIEAKNQREGGTHYYHSRIKSKDHNREYYDDFRHMIVNSEVNQHFRNLQDSYSSQTVSDHIEQDQPRIVGPRPTKFGKESSTDGRSSASNHGDSEKNDDRKDSTHRKLQPIHVSPDSQVLKNPVLYVQQSQRQTTPQQFGPQTFYSDNPKFKTTVTIPERFIQKPTTSTLNYYTATHLPVYQQNLHTTFAIDESHSQNVPKIHVLAKGTENNKPLIIKFPPPERENLDDTDEYDVSLNDALQPISTLHPRNAPTGVFLSNLQRVPQTIGFKRRSNQSNPSPQSLSELSEPSERYQVLKRVKIEMRSAPHQTKPLVQRADASALHFRYAMPSVIYRGGQTKNPSANIYAILS